MSKGTLIIEIEKSGEIKVADVKISNLTMTELVHMCGAVLNDVIIENADDEAEAVFWKVQMLKDICEQIGLHSLAVRINTAIERAEREAGAVMVKEKTQ